MKKHVLIVFIVCVTLLASGWSRKGLDRGGGPLVYMIHSYEWLPDNSGLVLARGAKPKKHDSRLWLVGADGSGLRRLTKEENCQEAPAVSPDGLRISHFSENDLVVYEMATGTSTRHSIDVWNPGKTLFSPDGNYLAFLRVTGVDTHSDGENEVWIYDFASAVAYPLGSTNVEGGIPSHRLLGFSTDSRKVFIWNTFEQYRYGRHFRYDLWEIDIASKKAVRLTSDGPLTNAVAGNMHLSTLRFVFHTWEQQDVDFGDYWAIVHLPLDIYIATAKPYSQVKLTSVGRNSYPVLSPDGQEVAYLGDAKGDGTSNEVYVIGSGGGVPLKLTSTGKQKLQVKWSPDGKVISFVQVEGDSHVLYVMNADGTGLKAIAK